MNAKLFTAPKLAMIEETVVIKGEKKGEKGQPDMTMLVTIQHENLVAVI
jgi:hypothetical protein